MKKTAELYGSCENSHREIAKKLLGHENTHPSSPSILQEINPRDQLQPTTLLPSPTVYSKNAKIRGRKKYTLN